MIHTMTIVRNNYDGTYFDAKDELLEIAGEMFELCDHHVDTCVNINISFVVDDDENKILIAILTYDEDLEDEAHDHEPVPVTPSAPSTGMEIPNDLSSLLGPLAIVTFASISN